MVILVDELEDLNELCKLIRSHVDCSMGHDQVHEPIDEIVESLRVFLDLRAFLAVVDFGVQQLLQAQSEEPFGVDEGHNLSY